MRTSIDATKSFFESGTTNIVKEYIDAFRASFLDRFAQILALVIDCCIEAKLFNQLLAFGSTASNANCTAASHLGELANDGANSTSSATDEHSLACFWLANLHQAKVCGQSSDA